MAYCNYVQLTKQVSFSIKVPYSLRHTYCFLETISFEILALSCWMTVQQTKGLRLFHFVIDVFQDDLSSVFQ